jgi:hypothetical protein
MASDWIEMRREVAIDPALIEIAGALSIDEYAVVGQVWSPDLASVHSARRAPPRRNQRLAARVAIRHIVAQAAGSRARAAGGRRHHAGLGQHLLVALQLPHTTVIGSRPYRGQQLPYVRPFNAWRRLPFRCLLKIPAIKTLKPVCHQS